MSLKEYARKRDFKKTAEPGPKPVLKKSPYRFVIQKHAASHLHYDFRLEMGGTLKSWAVPKGVPYTKGEKRLAVQVEDHPVAYTNFEGVIPEGQYGGGTVMVWDKGTFEPLSSAPEKELESGKLHFVLAGKKLKGEWYLVRLRGGREWLLIKGGSDLRPMSKKMDDTSALSGKSMKQLAGSSNVWQSNRAEKIEKKVEPKKEKKTVAHPRFIEPMKALLVDAPPQGDWDYEIKFDGFRAIVFKNGDAVRVLSRNNKEFNGRFPEIADAVANIESDDAVIDGEIVALDPKGRSSFQLLQRFELGEEHPSIVFYAFDLLRLNGEDLQRKPLAERKAKLEKLLKRSPDSIRYSASLGGEAKKLLPKIQQLGLEGLIGKRSDSIYEPGRRSGAWIKLKIQHEQEMVIGGYSDPSGSRQHFGALLMGHYEKKRLMFAGKVGTGFDGKLLKLVSVKMAKLASQSCPFDNVPEKKAGRYGQNLTRAEMKKCHWVKPRLVCQVRFAEWTGDGKLRQPVFLGLRDDKSASEVVREIPE